MSTDPHLCLSSCRSDFVNIDGLLLPRKLVAVRYRRSDTDREKPQATRITTLHVESYGMTNIGAKSLRQVAWPSGAKVFDDRIRTWYRVDDSGTLHEIVDRPHAPLQSQVSPATLGPEPNPSRDPWTHAIILCVAIGTALAAIFVYPRSNTS